MKKENDDDAYFEKAGAIKQLAAMDPMQLTEHLTEIHPNVSSIAPNISPHIFNSAASAVQFLNSRIPNEGNELLQDADHEPSIAQRKAWLDLHSVVSDPLSILDHVQNHTLNSHHVESMRAVYPDLHQEISQRMVEELGKAKTEGKEIPYARRLSIGKFMGQPVDSTMTQESFQAILKANAPREMPQNNTPKKPSGRELTQIDKANQLTQTQGQARQIDKLKS